MTILLWYKRLLTIVFRALVKDLVDAIPNRGHLVSERLAAERLHLPLPPSRHNSPTLLPVTHVYHNADPIPQGKSIVFDTVKLGWVLEAEDLDVPEAIEEEDCIDCFKWDFIDGESN
ncbi:hypothetical protein MPER_09304 [Moniliophthora perniciosa FA553]|nr:hypothetical protein MPER_09304 [Moniliophthora perniciosa FA553]